MKWAAECAWRGYKRTQDIVDEKNQSLAKCRENRERERVPKFMMIAGTRK
jgi:hypothetical protein